MLQLTTRMEINVTAKTVAADIGQLSTFVVKNRVPVVVTDPQFLETITLDRLKFGGGRTGRLAYKIICTVDFPRGKAYALEKLRDLPENVIFLADGFDILLTGGRSAHQTRQEEAQPSGFRPGCPRQRATSRHEKRLGYLVSAPGCGGPERSR